MKYFNRMKRQAGMTLIELTVVLLILIGLAGLLIPYVGSFVQTTHDSTNSNNLTQLNNAFSRYVGEKSHLPPHMDLLTNSNAATAAATGSCATGGANSTAVGGIYCGLANTAVFGTPVGYTLAANPIQVNSLVTSGINMAVANNPDIASKTFGTSSGMYMLNTTAASGWASAKFAPVAAGSFATVEEHLAAALGRDPMVYNTACYDYLAFGLGDNNELIQSTAMAAPVYFPQDANLGPAQRYAHFIAIVQVDNNNGAYTNGMMTGNCSNITEKAKFLGVVANVPSTESANLVGINTLLSQGWNDRAVNNN